LYVFGAALPTTLQVRAVPKGFAARQASAQRAPQQQHWQSGAVNLPGLWARGLVLSVRVPACRLLQQRTDTLR